MNYKHRVCNGRIDTKKRQCERCGKKWNIASWYTTTELMPITESRKERLAKRAAKPQKAPTSYAAWADSVPFVGFVASKLPNWPIKYRIVSVALFYIGLIGLVVWLWDNYPIVGQTLVFILLLPFIGLTLSLVVKYMLKGWGRITKLGGKG